MTDVEMTQAEMTPTHSISTSSLQSFASDLENDAFIDTNNRTLETHKWFIHHIELAKKKAQDEKLLKVIQKRITKNRDHHILLGALLCFTIVSYLVYWQHLLLVLRVLVILIWMVDVSYIFNLKIEVEPVMDSEIKLYMRFTRNGIFYKNTHYLFVGSKQDLEKAMNRLKNEAYNYHVENKESRADHDNLMDTPLDTFCTDDCGCDSSTGCDAATRCDSATECDAHENTQNLNYSCSQWELYNYSSHDELEDDALKIETLKEGMPNEIIYI